MDCVILHYSVETTGVQSRRFESSLRTFVRDQKASLPLKNENMPDFIFFEKKKNT